MNALPSSTAHSSSRALAAEHRDDRISIRRGDRELLTQSAKPGHRPFIHPIHAPDGDGILTEDAPPHHAWQHGLYIGLNDVDGVGFWTEGLTKNGHDGTFHPMPLTPPTIAANTASWTVVSEWRRPEGAGMLTETQDWRLTDNGSSYDLDLDWTLTAIVPLTFGAYAYGGLFVRMPFRERGSVITSEGHADCATAEGKRARWVAISMPIPDRRAADPMAGMAIMDHPGNPEHPAPWRVDSQLGIAPSRCIAGAWSLAAGASTTSRFRTFIHAGTTDVAAVEASWARFIR